jgi:hypothetical protein
MTSWHLGYHPVSEGSYRCWGSWSPGRFEMKMVPYTDGEIRITPARFMQANTRFTPSLGISKIGRGPGWGPSGHALRSWCEVGVLTSAWTRRSSHLPQQSLLRTWPAQPSGIFFVKHRRDRHDARSLRRALTANHGRSARTHSFSRPSH